MPAGRSKCKLLAMKSVFVEEAEQNFSAVLRIVRRGEEVEVIRRKKAVAKIVPVKKKGHKHDWADHFRQLDDIYGAKPAPGKPGSEIIIEGRR